MHAVFDALYAFGLALASPWLVWRTGRYRWGVAAKLFGRLTIARADGRPCAWFHGVSVGEVHLLGPLVAAFRVERPGWRVVVSSTTDTGLSEARARFGADAVTPFPFDFSWACGAALDHVRPAVVVLAESELWPNFLLAAARRRVPVVVANARVSPRSFTRLRRVKGAARAFLLGRVTAFAAQDADTAGRLAALGVPSARVTVTGSVKYDGAAGDRDTPKGRDLARLLRLDTGDRPLVVVAGSTHPPEEMIVLAAFARLRVRFPGLLLVLVPRHPDRSAAVAGLVAASGSVWARRSELREPVVVRPAVVLLDTVGELGATWGLADVGFVGGSLDGARGGQSMIEPAGYGVPAVFGPHVWNFRDAARRLVECGGAVQIKDAGELADALEKLLADAELRDRVGGAAGDLVRSQQGATVRTVEVILRAAEG